MTLHRILSIFLYALMVVSAVLVGIFYFGGIVEGTEGISGLEEPTITNTILNWSYILFAIAAIAAIAFPFGYMVMHPKNAKKAGLVVVALAVIVVVAYSLASDELLTFVTPTEGNEPTTLKYADTGIISMYLLLGVAVVSILYVEIAKMFK